MLSDMLKHLYNNAHGDTEGTELNTMLWRCWWHN